MDGRRPTARLSVLFNAWVFGRSWNSVALAQGNDKSRPALYRTTLIEMFPDGVRLVATDAYVLLKAWIPEIDSIGAPEPGHDTLPDEVAICADIDQQVVSLMKYAQIKTKQDGADTDVVMEMRLGTMIPGDQGTLTGMDQSAVSFRLDHAYDQTLEAPVFDGAFPHWRPLWFAHKWTQTGLVSFGADGILRLGKLSQLWDRAAIRFELGGTLGVSKVQIIAPDVNVSGLAMPVPGGPRGDASVPEEIIGVPASVEGIDHEFGEALDDFLADVLRTEVKPDDDTALEAAKRVQVLRAGHVVVAEQTVSVQVVADSLGVTAERAAELLVDLVELAVIEPIDGTEGDDEPKYAITEEAPKILEALATMIDDPDNPGQPDEGGGEPL